MSRSRVYFCIPFNTIINFQMNIDTLLQVFTAVKHTRKIECWPKRTCTQNDNDQMYCVAKWKYFGTKEFWGRKMWMKYLQSYLCTYITKGCRWRERDFQLNDMEIFFFSACLKRVKAFTYVDNFFPLPHMCYAFS